MRYDIKHLTVFVAVAEELNFHRAAERLNMAQPAISRIIIELEERLGAKLLERTTRSVRLTEPGRYLLEEAQQILGRLESAESNVRLIASGTKAILRIGYTTITGHSLMPDIAHAFRGKNPDVHLELTYMTSPQLRDKILQDEIDLGFLVGPFESSEIATTMIARHRLVVLLPSKHPLTKKDVLTIDDIASEPIVLGTSSEWPSFRPVVVKAFQAAGQVLSVAQEASSLTGILGLVTAGVGITIFCDVPRFCGTDVIVHRPLMTKPTIIVETHLAWRRTHAGSALRRFIETSQHVGKARPS